LVVVGGLLKGCAFIHPASSLRLEWLKFTPIHLNFNVSAPAYCLGMGIKSF
jgi:hypothetical protein